MNGENPVDLGDLQREKEKHAAALAGVSSKIQAIEEKARLEREAAERKERELANLHKKLKACRDAISWAEKIIAELNERSLGQMNLLLGGATEPYFAIKMTLQEASEWERELELLRQFEVSLPQEIEKLTGSS